ncbi:MAG: hypothetical protein M3Y85_11935 [Bacteroidota bacterium]|nr:hypothetical protein [Bacteroidota bacterium]
MNPVFVIASFILFAFCSCGTLSNALSKGKRPSFIVNAPKDVVIKMNGKVLDLESELFTSTVNIGATASKNYYTAAVNIPYKHPVTLEMSSASLGKTATVELKPKSQGAIFWANLIFFPIVGHIIDGATNNNKVLTPKYIDVTSVLNNVALKDWPSQAKLKKIEKEKATLNTSREVTKN